MGPIKYDKKSVVAVLDTSVPGRGFLSSWSSVVWCAKIQKYTQSIVTTENDRPSILDLRILLFSHYHSAFSELISHSDSARLTLKKRDLYEVFA